MTHLNAGGFRSCWRFSLSASRRVGARYTCKHLNFSPISHEPLVDVGSLATGQSVTVQNLSSAPVPLGVGSVTAPFEIASTDCPATLAPKQSCSYTFSFRPTQAGPSASTLSVGSGADAQALSLSGRGAVLVSGTRAELETFSATAPTGTTFVQVVFASFGFASGTAPNFVQGTCHATASASVVAAHFLNKGSGSVLVSNTIFGDPCLNVQKKLYVVLRAG